MEKGSPASIESLLRKLKAERQRRSNIAVESLHRKTLILRTYLPLHPHLYTLQVN